MQTNGSAIHQDDGLKLQRLGSLPMPRQGKRRGSTIPEAQLKEDFSSGTAVFLTGKPKLETFFLSLKTSLLLSLILRILNKNMSFDSE